MKKLFLNILDKKRLEIFERLPVLLGEDYYLAGGTALALQIGHRESLDFDLFRNKEITFSVKERILKGLKEYSPQTLVDTSDELSIVLKKDIKLTLLNYYWDPVYPLVRRTGFVPLLCVKDIVATKAYALGRRGNYRDYFDLYVTVKNGFTTLKEIIRISRKKYGDVFSERMFLEQLVYTKDFEKDEKLRYVGERQVSPRQIADYFKKNIHSNAKLAT